MLAVASSGQTPAGRAGVVSDLRRRRNRGSREDYTAYIGMLVFLASWGMLFAGIFFAYAVVRSGAPVWPPLGAPRLPVLLPGIATAVIAASSVAVALAQVASAPRGGATAGRRLAAAALLGTAFLALQAVTWWRVHAAGLGPSDGAYGSVFYALTAIHAAHVTVGLGALAWLSARAFGAGVSRLAVRLWALYWHFVGAVWLVLYAAVYLV